MKYEVKHFKIHPLTQEEYSKLRMFDVIDQNQNPTAEEIIKVSGREEGAVKEYISAAIKREILSTSSGPGDKKVAFSQTHRRLLGVGFSEDKCIITVMDLDGNIESKEHIEISPLFELRGRNKEIKEIVEKVRNGARSRGKAFYSAGIAVPPGMKEKNEKCEQILAEGISRLFGCPVFIAREETACGYGEQESGEKTKGKITLYMHADIGAGVVLKDEEILEMSDLEEDAIETYLRPWKQFSIVETTKNLVNKGVGTDIAREVEGDVSRITLEMILDAAEKKDELSEDLVKRSGLAQGVRVAYLANMYGVEIVVLGGGVEKTEGGFSGFVKESATRFMLEDIEKKVKIMPGVLGREASSIGAALLCRRELFMEV